MMKNRTASCPEVFDLTPANFFVAMMFLLAALACLNVASAQSGDTDFRELPAKPEPVIFLPLPVQTDQTPNPFLSFLPEGAQPDYDVWTKRMEVDSKARRAAMDEMQILSGTFRSLISQNEIEGLGVQGLNDDSANAEFISGFGTGAGDDGEVDINGNLQAPITPGVLSQNAEDEGQINNATVTGIGTNSGVSMSGTIGDGPYGSAAISVSMTDVDSEPDGRVSTANATGLTPFNRIVEMATIGDGSFGSSGSGEGDFDFYALPVNGAQPVQIELTRAPGETSYRPILALYDPSSNFLFALDDAGTPGTIVYNALVTSSATDWYIAVGGNSNIGGSLPPQFPSDVEDETTGPGAGSEGNYQLTITYPMPGDFDVMAFTVTSGELVQIEVDTDATGNPGGLDPMVAVFDSSGDFVLNAFGQPLINDDGSNGAPGAPFDSYISHVFDTAGTYYAFIAGFSGLPSDETRFPSDRFDSSTGPGAGSEGDYVATISRIDQDVDFYSFDAEAGDIIGANLTGGGQFVALVSPTDDLLISTAFDTGGAYPPGSLLPGGGNASIAQIANVSGRYSVAVTGGFDAYGLEIRAFRPPQEATKIRQKLFIDFAGPLVDTGKWGSGSGVVIVTPLSGFLTSWGLSAGDENQVIDAILAVASEKLSEEIKASGLNDAFDIEILNSRDHASPWGDPDVSRVIVGGTQAEVGLSTIGIAQSIDIGNYDMTEDSIVLLDLLSDPNTSNPNSLNSFSLDPGASIIDIIGDAVGKVVAHEAGHFFANWHTSRVSPTPNVMDEGGDLGQLIGIGADSTFGSVDDVTVSFGADVYSSVESFIGTEDTLNSLSFGLTATEPSPLPFVQALPDLNSNGSADLLVLRNGSIIAEVRDGAAGALLKSFEFLNSGFTPITAAWLPDADGNGVSELGVLASRNSDGRVVVEMRNVSGAEAPRQVWFAANHEAVDLAVVEGDADNNGVPELAVLSRRNSDGRGLVEVKNAFGATNPRALWAGAGLTSSQVVVLDDADSNGIPEVAILSTRDSDGRIVAEIKNAAGATLPNAVWFMPGNTAIDIVAVPDKDNNGIPEVAVLSSRNSDGRIVVEIKNASGATAPSAVWFAPGHTAIAVEAVNDSDSNGVPEVAVLSTRDSDGRILVEVKNTFGATAPNPVFYSPGFTARGITIIDDADNNGIPEAGVLMIRDSDGRILVQGRNTAGAEASKDYWFSP